MEGRKDRGCLVKEVAFIQASLSGRLPVSRQRKCYSSNTY